MDVYCCSQIGENRFKESRSDVGFWSHCIFEINLFLRSMWDNYHWRVVDRQDTQVHEDCTWCYLSLLCKQKKWRTKKATTNYSKMAVIFLSFFDVQMNKSMLFSEVGIPYQSLRQDCVSLVNLQKMCSHILV